jgi:serine/threonine protein phosphatase 1
MSRTFVIGDIHGAHKALVQCLQRSSFNYETDHLICLGDVCDGWPETQLAIDELLRLKNLTYILGNHDFWTLEWMRDGFADDVWLEQGGQATINSYSEKVPAAHRQFLENALPYFKRNNNLFVHAGIDPLTPVEHQSIQTFLWDRKFAQTAHLLHSKSAHGNLTGFDNVYIGHTPIAAPPKRMCEVWFMDTGAGWSGKLSMMNIATNEIFMSDNVPELYPGIQGRKKIK